MEKELMNGNGHPFKKKRFPTVRKLKQLKMTSIG